jgi:hypothetical protein
MGSAMGHCAAPALNANAHSRAINSVTAEKSFCFNGRPPFNIQRNWEDHFCHPVFCFIAFHFTTTNNKMQEVFARFTAQSGKIIGGKKRMPLCVLY